MPQQQKERATGLCPFLRTLARADERLQEPRKMGRFPQQQEATRPPVRSERLDASLSFREAATCPCSLFQLDNPQRVVTLYDLTMPW